MTALHSAVIATSVTAVLALLIVEVWWHVAGKTTVTANTTKDD